MYAGLGAFFGFALTATVLNFFLTTPDLDDREIYAIAAGGAIVGSFLGRMLLRAAQRSG